MTTASTAPPASRPVPQPASIERRPNLAALVLAALSLAVYAATRTNMISQDSITYAGAAVSGKLARLLHPHHLAYNPLLSAVLRITGNFERSLAALHALQWINVVIGAAAVGVMSRLLWSLGVEGRRNALLTAIFATANGLWFYSSQIEVYTLTALLCLLTLLVAVVRRAGTPLLALGAVFCSLALLSHQTAIFFVAGLAAHSMLGSREERRRRLAALVVIPLVVVGVLYVASAWLVTGDATPRGLWLFATTYAHVGQWGGIGARNFIKAPFGLVNAFVAIDEIDPGSPSPGQIIGAILMVASAVAAIIAIVHARRSSDARDGRRLMAMLAVWASTHSAFVWWWHPANVEFWIILVPVLLLAFALRVVCRPKQMPTAATVALVLLLAGQIVLNTPPIVRDSRVASSRVTTARNVSSLTRSGDVLVVTSHPGMIGYYQYFSEARVLFPFPATLSGDSAGLARTLDTLSNFATAARVHGRNMIIEGDPLLVPGSHAKRTAQEQRAISAWIAAFGGFRRVAGADTVIVVLDSAGLAR